MCTKGVRAIICGNSISILLYLSYAVSKRTKSACICEIIKLSSKILRYKICIFTLRCPIFSNFFLGNVNNELVQGLQPVVL